MHCLVLISILAMKTIDTKHYLIELQLLREKISSFDEYPFSLPAIRHLHSLTFHPLVTLFVGENATGKSTLLEAIAVAFGLNPEGGTRNFAFVTRASHSSLHKYVRLVKGVRRPRDSFFLRAESLFNLGTEIERLDSEPEGGPPIIDSYGGRSLHEQSHGESFYSLFMNRFGGGGVYILDEPEAALSPMRQMGLLSIIHDLLSRDSQFVIATHSPILMAYPEAWIYELTEEGITKVNYTDTEHYTITKEFLNNPQKMLNILLGE